MPDRPLNILFLCTHNSARSIMAEAIMNKLAGGRMKAYSAGSQPAGRINPHALTLLKTLGYDASKFRSKSWSELAEPRAPILDFVFTVCDDAAGESCPVWPGQPMSAHWGIPDPSLATGSEAEIAAVFANTHRMLNQRIGIFLALPLKTLEQISLQARLHEIGRMEGASPRALDPRK